MSIIKRVYRASPAPVKSFAKAVLPDALKSLIIEAIRTNKDTSTDRNIADVKSVTTKAFPRRAAKTSRPNATTLAQEEKLWHGFSKIGIEGLNQTRLDLSNRDIDRVHSAYMLMRWYMAEKDFELALSMSRQIDAIGVPENYLFRYQILKYECLHASGRHDEAGSFVRDLEPLRDNNYLLALANHLAHDSPHNGSAQLELVNKIFRRNKLRKIALIDPTAPLHIANIAGVKEDNILGTDQPLVTIIMPAFNAEETIRFSVLSLLQQSWRNIEVIVVDDCSGDSTPNIIEEMIAADSRLSLIRLNENRGAYHARNTGLEQARGDFITVHDADDWSHPEMIELQMQPLLKNRGCPATMSFLSRVDDNIKFLIRPYRPKLEYIHWNYSSLLFRRSVVDEIGGWDEVTAGGDSEFLDRIRLIHGRHATQEVLPNVPLTFALTRAASATESKETSLRSATFGGRHEYVEQYRFWQSRNEFVDTKLRRTSADAPFPAPNALLSQKFKRDQAFDIVLASDLSMPGGTRRCNLAYLKNIKAMGGRVALFHVPRLTASKLRPVDAEYRSMAIDLHIPILTHEDVVSTKLVLLHFPPAFHDLPDALPRIEAESALIVVNQLPNALYSGRQPVYDQARVERNIKEWLGIVPDWVPISNLTRDILSVGFGSVYRETWLPPLENNSWFDRQINWRGAERITPIIGRHGRDHWTKWPSDEKSITDAYFVGSDVEVQILGGAEAPQKILSTIPKNWIVHPFDSIQVRDFLDNIDIYVNFVNHDYIEEFGRNVMEAMASGIPVVMGKSFEKTFGDAALYCEPKDVSSMVSKIWKDRELYFELAHKGRSFVIDNSAPQAVQKRLRPYIEASL